MKMRFALVLAFLLIFSLPAFSQIKLTLAWDASSTIGTPENPVRYRLYTCSDAGLTTCTFQDAGTALTIQHDYASGTVYQFCTAYQDAVDGVPSAGVVESGKSNVLTVNVHIPPGNPGKPLIKTQ
jgi:hypothetical protein